MKSQNLNNVFIAILGTQPTSSLISEGTLKMTSLSHPQNLCTPLTLWGGGGKDLPPHKVGFVKKPIRNRVSTKPSKNNVELRLLAEPHQIPSPFEIGPHD